MALFVRCWNTLRLKWVLILCSVMFFSGVTIAADVEKAYQWLLEQKQSDGSFLTSQSLATEFQAIHESLTALDLGNRLTPTERESVVSYIATQSYWDTESIQRLLTVAPSIEGKDTLVTTLLSHQAQNGGFGALQGYDANVLDTSFALLALKTLPSVDPTVISHTLQFLSSQQQNDGSFHLNQSNNGSVYLTALISKALQGYLFEYQVETMIERANQYLLAQQRHEGGWGEVWLSAYVLEALIPTYTDNSAYSPALEFLSASQAATGGWDNDVFSTALALRVLHLSKNLTKPTSPSHGRVTGIVVDNQSKQPMSNVEIRLEGPASYRISTTQDGDFLLDEVLPGEYVATYVKSAYQGGTQALNVSKGLVVNLGTMALNAIPTQGVLAGFISDGETGQAIAGASIEISGQGSATSDEAGQYSVIVADSTVNIAVSAAGYQAVQANGSAQLGATTTFSPQLFKQAPTDPSVTVSGGVLDADTSSPIPGVTVTVEGSDSVAITDSQGRYELTTLLTQVKLAFDVEGYQSAQTELLAAPGASITLTDYYLTPVDELLDSTLSGQVIDKATGSPIIGAVIEVSPDSMGAVTDNQGRYELTRIQSQDLNVLVRAGGYLSDALSISIAEPTVLSADFALVSASQQGVDIVNAQTASDVISAYEDVAFSFIATNNGNEAKNVMMFAEVLDENGVVLSKTALGSATGAVDQDVLMTLLPGAEIQADTSWFSGNSKPGAYGYRIRLFDGLSTSVLAERTYPFSIKTTKRFTSLAMVPRPQFGYVGQNVEVDFIGSLENRSNVPVALNFGYALQSPESGEVVLSGLFEAEVLPNQTTLSLPFAKQAYQLAEKGNYTLHLAVHSETVPAQLMSKPIVVSPTTRLILTQGLTPDKVLPKSNQRVSVQINLEGVE